MTHTFLQFGPELFVTKSLSTHQQLCQSAISYNVLYYLMIRVAHDVIDELQVLTAFRIH